MGGKDFTARKLTWLMSSEAAPRIIFCQLRPKSQHKKRRLWWRRGCRCDPRPVPEHQMFAPSPSWVLPSLLRHTRAQKNSSYTVSFPLSPFLSSSTAWPVGFSPFMREHITISSPGEPWPAKPPPIRTLVMQLFLCILPWHVPPRCTPNMADGRESPAWFPKTTPGAQNPRSCFQPAFSCFFFFSVRQMCCCKIFLVTGNVKKEKYIYFSCRSHFLESAGEARNKASSYERKEKQLLYLLMLNDSD